MEYCGVELTEEGLQHYGIKGMHWGVRRYQPYPGEADGRKLSKHKVRKAMRAIKRNSKRYAQRNWYANRSLDESLQNASKAADARAQGYTARAEKFDKKAKKQASDTAKHIAGMADLKKEINSAVNKIESTGEYKVMADKGRTFLSGSGRYLTGWALAGIPGMVGVDIYRSISGKPIDGKINYKKPILRNTNGQKESGGFVDPVIRVTPKSKSESSMDGFWVKKEGEPESQLSPETLKKVSELPKEHKGITKLGKADDAVWEMSRKYYPNHRWTEESATKALKENKVKLTDSEWKAAKRNIETDRTFRSAVWHPSMEHLYNYETERRKANPDIYDPKTLKTRKRFRR